MGARRLNAGADFGDRSHWYRGVNTGLTRDRLRAVKRVASGSSVQLAQCLEQPLPRASRDFMTQSLLLLLHRLARPRRQHTARRTHVVTARGEESLQVSAFGT